MHILFAWNLIKCPCNFVNVQVLFVQIEIRKDSVIVRTGTNGPYSVSASD